MLYLVVLPCELNGEDLWRQALHPVPDLVRPPATACMCTTQHRRHATPSRLHMDHHFGEKNLRAAAPFLVGDVHFKFGITLVLLTSAARNSGGCNGRSPTSLSHVFLVCLSMATR
jgi:hypothetical protein